MYLAHLGKKAFRSYQRRYPELCPNTVRDFFHEVFAPLFFQPDSYLISLSNTPYFQPVRQKKTITPAVLQEAGEHLEKEIEELEDPQYHLFIGGYTTAPAQTTAGQVSMRWEVDEETAYASWLGAALGVGVEGGFVIGFDDDAIVDLLVDGWFQYRELLRNTPGLSGNQVNTWNGQWLVHATGRSFVKSHPLPHMNIQTSGDKTRLATVSWVKLLFGLCRSSSQRSLTYVYKLGQSNTTVGFILIDLPQIRTFQDLCLRLFPNHGGLNQEEIGRVYKTDQGFKVACESAVIGLHGIRPKGLRQHMDTSTAPVPKLPSSGDDYARFLFTQAWIVAMLNSTELYDLAGEIADHLREFEGQATRGKKDRQRLVKDLLGASNRRAFIEKARDVIDQDDETVEPLSQTVQHLVNMPARNIPFFLTLLRFRYAEKGAKSP